MADTPRDSKAAGMEGEGKWEESVRDGVDDTDPLLPEVLDGALGGLCMDALKRPNYTAAYLRDLGLSSVALLAEHPALQEVDLTGNRVHDLRFVRALPRLRVLHISSNGLHNVDSLVLHDGSEDGAAQPVRYLALEQLDLSYNSIRYLPEALGVVARALRVLHLESNQLTILPDLRALSLLEELDVSHNELSALHGIEGLPLLHSLRAQNNSLAGVGGVLATLPHLRSLALDGNRLWTLRGFVGCSSLCDVSLADNGIVGIRELHFLQDAPHLRRLTLAGNPVAQGAEFRVRVLNLLHSVLVLDGEVITPQEKVKANNAHGADLQERWRAVHELGDGLGFHDGVPVVRPTDGPPCCVHREEVELGGKALAVEVVRDREPGHGATVHVFAAGSSELLAELHASEDFIVRVLEEAKEDVAGSARDAPADAAAAAAALQELPKPWAREQEQAAAERANAERAAPLLVQRLQVEPAPSAPHEVQYTLQPPPKRAKPLSVRRGVRCDDDVMIVHVRTDGPASYHVGGYVPATSTQYSLAVPQEQVQSLLGQDAGQANLPSGRRRAVMEMLADLVALQRRQGRSHLCLRRPEAVAHPAPFTQSTLL